MNSKLLVIALLVTITCFISFGCGISQQQYDAKQDELVKTQQDLELVQAELEAAQATISDLTSDLSKVETDLDSVQDQNSELTSDLNEIQTELETTIIANEELSESLEKIQDEYTSFKSEAQQLFILLDSALELNNEILGVSAGIILENNETIYNNCQDITDSLSRLRDIKIDEFNAIWNEAYIETPSEWNLYFSPFVEFMAFHAERIKDKVGWLSEHLNK
jgi:chromosome segregation ATPase